MGGTPPSPPALAILLAGLCLYALYLSYTGAGERNPDAGPHLLYVRYVADQHALPAKAACNVCHHPPAYYVLAAGVYRALTLVGAAEPAFGLQVFSLALFSVFLVCAALTITRLLPGDAPRRRLSRLAATALVVFWPYSVINAVRVGNDVMLYAIAGGVLLSLVKWYQERTTGSLVAACALSALGLFTKANAVALFGLVVAVVALALAETGNRRALLRAAAPALAILAVAGVLSASMGRSAVGTAPGDVLGNATNINSAWLTPRSVRYYLTFDPLSFVARPYATVSLSGDREPTYWNHLIKSSLFGTRRVVLDTDQREPEPTELALGMNGLLLLLLAVLIAGQALGLRKASKERRLAAVMAGVFVATGLGFHLLVPYGFHADFRFIYPVLVPLSVLYVEGAERAWARKAALGWAALGLAGLMGVLSIAYFLPFTWHERPSRRAVSIGDLSQRPAPAPSGSAPQRPRRPMLLPQ